MAKKKKDTVERRFSIEQFLQQVSILPLKKAFFLRTYPFTDIRTLVEWEKETKLKLHR